MHQRVAQRNFLVFMLVLNGVEQNAQAAPKDRAASDQDEHAMLQRFLLEAEFAKAEQTLRDAIEECGASDCSTEILVRLRCHLGVVLVQEGNITQAVDQFEAALRLNSTISLEPYYVNSFVKNAFSLAKRRVVTTDSTTPTAVEPLPTFHQDAIEHTPFGASPERTSIPIFAAAAGATGMTLHFMPKDRSVFVARKMDWGRSFFSAWIDCDEVPRSGSLSYYIIAVDKNGEALGSVGSSQFPLRIEIKPEPVSPLPTMLGATPPMPCRSLSDCEDNPNLRGCPDPRELLVRRHFDPICFDSKDCTKGRQCIEGACVLGDPGWTCEEGQTCERERPSAHVTFWADSQLGTWQYSTVRAGYAGLALPAELHTSEVRWFSLVAPIRK